ncbi:MAG: class I SAM-dependent methyltransferase [Anaerolineae bacterium]|nr:class I SAM-dependent methyltransferase [Anaerolineae bacterium]
MPDCTYQNLEALRRAEHQPGLEGKVATLHLKLYHLVAQMTAPVVLEFGVDKGMSTCLLAAACEENGGWLYSVDIADCSAAIRSPVWTFIQSDDLQVAEILAAAPALRDGVHLLHIDSAHSREHVEQQLLRWYPYVRQGGYITFHDVDATPYLAGQRKDDPRHEPEALGVPDTIRRFFYANEDALFLEFHFGSTGMGIMRKLAPLGTRPQPPLKLHTRQVQVSLAGLFWTGRALAAALVKRFLR